MPRVRVSTIGEVLELLREQLVLDFDKAGVHYPPEVAKPGNCDRALTALLRLRHRAIAPRPRTVLQSEELGHRELNKETREALDAIRWEIERGDDVNQRLTRYFYKAGFNDFLFNNFDIQHLHLGHPGAAQDKTRQHAMSGGSGELLFAKFEPETAYFLDVMDHGTFSDATRTKSLLEIALRNWPQVLDRYKAGVRHGGEPSFEEAFALARNGIGTVYALGGFCFLTGPTLKGGTTPKDCTSWNVGTASDKILRDIRSVVEYATREADSIATKVAPSIGRPINEFKLEVVQAGGEGTVLRDMNTGIEFRRQGQCFRYTWAH